METQRFQELCDAFLLSGLEGDELREFEAELRRRGAEGELLLDETREAMGLMALASDAVVPPPSLREKLLAEVRGDVSGRGAGEGRGVGRHEAERGNAEVPLRGTGTQPDSAQRPSAWGRPALLAAAVIAAVALGIANVNLRNTLADRDAALAEARRTLGEADSLRQQLAALREDLGTMAAPSGSVYSLAGTETRPDARARVFVDPQTGRALVLAYELPILSAESVYQLWAIRDGQPFSIGTFVARPDGPARLDLDSIDPVEGADLLAVTIEPSPGQPAPTGEMVLISG